MRSINLPGSVRTEKGKSQLHQLRQKGYVPAELYGHSGNVHFSIFGPHLRDIIFTPEKFKVNLVIDDKIYTAVTKEVQYHPMSSEILHIDFHEIDEETPIKIDLPIRFTGVAHGVREGGKLLKKLRNLKVKAAPKYLPEAIEVDVTELGLGKSVKVRDVKVKNMEVLNSPSIPLATVEIPRAMRGKQTEEAAAEAKKK